MPPTPLRHRSLRPILLAGFGLLHLLPLVLACDATSGRTTPTSTAATPRTITVAVVPFGLASGTAPPPVDVADVVRRDLAAVDVRLANETDLPERPVRLSEVHLEVWQSFPADYLVVGLVAGVHDGGHEVEFRLIDPRAEARERATLLGFVVASGPDALEATAHRVARLIRERLATLRPRPAVTS